MSAAGRGALTALSLAVAVGSAGWVAHRAGLGAGAVLTALPVGAHALAAAACTAELVARALRVRYAAQGLGLRLSLGAALRMQLAGDALAAVTPARVGADPAKLAVLSSAGVPAGAAGALILAEVFCEALLLVAAAALLVLATDTWWLALGPLAYAAVVTSAAAGALLASRSADGGSPRWWSRLGGSHARWRALRLAGRSFRAYAGDLRRIPTRPALGIVGSGILHIAARLAVLPALALSLGADRDLLEELVLRPFFVLYATSLLPPPGGGGGTEITFSTLLAGVLPPETLAATLVWWRVYTFYLVAAAGWLHLGARRVRARTSLDIDSSRAASPLFTAQAPGP